MIKTEFLTLHYCLLSILINLWEVTVQALQKALSNVPKRLTSQYLYERMYNALRRLWEFFHADGNGVTKEDLDSSEIYKVSVVHCMAVVTL